MRHTGGFCSLVSLRALGGRSASVHVLELPVFSVSSPVREDSHRGQERLAGPSKDQNSTADTFGSRLQGRAPSCHLLWGHTCHVLGGSATASRPPWPRLEVGPQRPALP